MKNSLPAVQAWAVQILVVAREWKAGTRSWWFMRNESVREKVTGLFVIEGEVNLFTSCLEPSLARVRRGKYEESG